MLGFRSSASYSSSKRREAQLHFLETSVEMHLGGGDAATEAAAAASATGAKLPRARPAMRPGCKRKRSASSALVGDAEATASPLKRARGGAGRSCRQDENEDNPGTGAPGATDALAGDDDNSDSGGIFSAAHWRAMHEAEAQQRKALECAVADARCGEGTTASASVAMRRDAPRRPAAHARGPLPLVSGHGDGQLCARREQGRAAYDHELRRSYAGDLRSFPPSARAAVATDAAREGAAAGTR